MKNLFLIILPIAYFVNCSTLLAQNNEFYGYYTKIVSEQKFEKYSRTGKYADIVINIKPHEKLIFWRGTSYLPVWETSKGRWPLKEIISRKGDGTLTMPDANNTFSHVKIVENSADKIVVLWRYLPDFTMNNYPHYPINANPLSFVEELYTISSDGTVIREIKQGTDKIEHWEDNMEMITQKISLKTDGIIYLSETKTDSPKHANTIDGNRKVDASMLTPIMSLSFDEGNGNSTAEAVTHNNYSINGHKALWKQGVSGTALQFDGYTSSIEISQKDTKELCNNITLEAWVCIGAYPWNWVPVAQIGKSDAFSLGINDKGLVELILNTEADSFNLLTDKPLNRNRWYYIAATINAENKEWAVYINGNLEKKESLICKTPNLQLSDINIGISSKPAKASDPVRPKFNFPSIFGFDGLLDEIRIYNYALSANEIQTHYTQFNPGESICFIPDIEIRHLPVMENTNHFKARYTNLPYYETWDNMWRYGNYADIVVGFDESPSHFVFWKGTNYVPCIVNDKKQWFCNEFNETWGTGGGDGCQEPMSDKKILTSHARIIEQSAARVVVHWRVALLDTKQNIIANYDTLSNWGDWSDWYYYIYPDGSAAKEMCLWTSGKPNHEWQESMLIIGENTRPEEILEQAPVYWFVNDAGQEISYNWQDAFKAKVDYANNRIFVINLKSDWKPYTIGDFTGGNVFRGEEITPYSVFCNWNHWPTALVNCDGRFSSFPDRASHTSLNNLFTDFYEQSPEDAPYYKKILLEGMTDKSPTELYPLSKSWLNPPSIEPLTGIKSSTYNPAQKAYIIQPNSNALEFQIKATNDSPLINPAFVIKNWTSNKSGDFYINNIVVETDSLCRQGVVRDTNGENMLVVWLKMESNETTHLKIKK